MSRPSSNNHSLKAVCADPAQQGKLSAADIIELAKRHGRGTANRTELVVVLGRAGACGAIRAPRFARSVPGSDPVSRRKFLSKSGA
jgi:hypothetical protein